MKLIKSAMLGALTLTATGMLAHATTYTVIRFTGSTAFRAVACHALLNSVFDSSPGYGFNGSGSGEVGLDGANTSEFAGNIGGTPYLIKCSWSGSEYGIYATDYNGTGIAINFPDPANQGTPYLSNLTNTTSIIGQTSGVNGLADGSGSTATTDSAHYEVAIPDATFSDTYDAASQFSTAGTATYHGATYPGSPTFVGANSGNSDGIVGVIPFEWVANNASTFTGITSQLARTLFAKGKVHESQFFGNTTDTNFVYLIGRDNDSGTRLTSVSESGYGTATAVKQYMPYPSTVTSGYTVGNAISSAGGTINSLQLCPTETVDGITLLSPQGGYSSGGSLSKALDNVWPSGANGVTYLGASDANNAQDIGTSATFDGGAGAARALTYNGIAPTLNNIKTGLYTFWGYEHIYYLASNANATELDAIATSIANQSDITESAIGGAAATSASLDVSVSLSGMQATRTSDGGTVSHN
jgi:hypothetical protein